jgi:hypothetical protein
MGRRSSTRSSGFDGLSPITSFVFARKPPCHPGAEKSTKVVSTPKRGSSFSSSARVPP